MQSQGEYLETSYFMTQQVQDAVVMKALRERPVLSGRLDLLKQEATCLSNRLLDLGKALRHPEIVTFDGDQLPEVSGYTVIPPYPITSSELEEFKRIPLLVRDYRRAIADLKANTKFLEDAGVKEVK